MKILLTGGHGFIGKNLRESLGAKHDVLAPTRQELTLTDATTVAGYLQEKKIDLVVHAAGVGGNRQQSGEPNIISDNLKMFFNLVRAKEHFQRLIVLGSGAEYGKNQPLVGVAEADFDKRVPADEYGFSKYVMAKYAEQSDFITHLRLFGVYGPHEDYQTRFISNAICKILLGLPITIKQNVFFDYLYVKDLGVIMEKFISRTPQETFYNIGTGERTDLLSIAKLILKITESDLPIQIGQTGLNKEYTANIDKLKQEFPALAYTPLEQAITELVAYYRSILPSLDKSLFLHDI